VQVTVSGRVQGVFYRATCAREAEARGLGGWVRNVPDGRVEAVFEGPEPQVEAMLAWCRVGPSAAYVEHVEVTELDPTGDRTFRVRG
jgi:acylphosphatase